MNNFAPTSLILKPIYSLALLLLFYSCGHIGQVAPVSEASSIDIFYQIVNARNDNGTQFYDIYIRDTTSIKKLNDYLKSKFNPGDKTWIEINYYDDSLIAKDYFKNQFDDKVSEKEKDRLFKSFVANYKHNPSTGYDAFIIEH